MENLRHGLYICEGWEKLNKSILKIANINIQLIEFWHSVFTLQFLFFIQTVL